jgi:hypothetical protein
MSNGSMSKSEADGSLTISTLFHITSPMQHAYMHQWTNEEPPNMHISLTIEYAISNFSSTSPKGHVFARQSLVISHRLQCKNHDC